MLLGSEFAKGVNSEFHKAMATYTDKEDDDNKNQKRFRSDTTHFCCAIVLLAIIGQRAGYLLSGEDVMYCEREWKDVYLS